MRHSILLILLYSCISASCHNEKINDEAQFNLEAVEKESNQINLTAVIRYSLTSRAQKRLLAKYGSRYKDSLILPAASTVSRKMLIKYSAGEIYNYKRDEIQQKLKVEIKTALAQDGIELTDFIIRSVGLSDTLLKKLEQEHLERATNNR